MTQANSVLSTPPVNTSATPETSYIAVSRLESPICDIANMASVNSSLLEDLQVGHLLLGQHVEQLKFCAYHLEQMIKAFKVQYYEVLAGKAVA